MTGTTSRELFSKLKRLEWNSVGCVISSVKLIVFQNNNIISENESLTVNNGTKTTKTIEKVLECLSKHSCMEQISFHSSTYNL